MNISIFNIMSIPLIIFFAFHPAISSHVSIEPTNDSHQIFKGIISFKDISSLEEKYSIYMFHEDESEAYSGSYSETDDIDDSDALINGLFFYPYAP